MNILWVRRIPTEESEGHPRSEVLCTRGRDLPACSHNSLDKYPTDRDKRQISRDTITVTKSIAEGDAWFYIISQLSNAISTHEYSTLTCAYLKPGASYFNLIITHNGFPLVSSEDHSWALSVEVEAAFNPKSVTASEAAKGLPCTAGLPDSVVHLNFKANKPRDPRQGDDTITFNRI